MASVDDRIVAMQFDNSAFESKIATTMGSLDKLKGSLDFANSKKGMDDLSAAGKNFNLEGMATALEGISGKFSVMGAAAFTVIQNIVNRAVDAGISISKSLTVGQIGAGFNEYELKMGSIQTMMAGSGASLAEVNSRLAELNAYSDKTIYSFKDMTSNIGKFTNSGVSLKDSVAAIQGVANVAAVSGANAEEASRAMYNFGQALSTGSVKLIDWKSIELANMGTKEFKTQLMDAAVKAGTLTKGTGALADQYSVVGSKSKETISATKGFNDSLKEEWMTSAVLTTTLGNYADETTDIGKKAFAAATDVKTFSQMMDTLKESAGSGWAATSEILFGDFNEAKKLWTNINNVVGGMIGKSAQARNDLLQGWSDLGGRTVLIEALGNAIRSLGYIIKPIKEAFREIFPPMTSQRLYDLTQKFLIFTNNLTPSGETIKKIKRIFEGLFTAFKIGIDIVKGIFGVFGDLFDRFAGGGGGILDFFTKIADKVIAFSDMMNLNNGIAKFFDDIELKIENFINKVAEVIDYFKMGFTDMGTNEGTGILLLFNRIGMALKEVKDYITKFVVFFKAGFTDDIITGMASTESKFKEVSFKIGEILGNIKDWIANFFGSKPVDKIKGSFDDLSTGVDKSKDAFGRLHERFAPLIAVFHAIGAVIEWLWGKLGTVWDALGKFGNFLKDKFSNLPSKIAEVMGKGDYNQVLDGVNTGLFVGLVLLFKKFTGSFDKLMSGGGLFKSITDSFDSLTGVLDSMQTKIKAEALFKIAAAVGILALAMIVLSLMDSEALTRSMTAMSVGFTELVVAMGLLNKAVSGTKEATKLAILSAGLILLAAAMLILALAMKIFATMSWEEISKGLVGVGGGLGIIVAAMNLMPDDVKMIKAGLGILAISAGMLVLATAMKIFATMSWEEMAKGLTGVAGGLGLIVGAMNLMPKGMLTKSVALIAIAIALNILALAVLAFGKMDLKTMVQGLIGIGAALLIIAGAMRLMPNGALMALQGAGLLMIGIGLVAISSAIAILGNMSWENMIKGLLGISAALLVLVIAAKAMEGSGTGAIAITVMSVAMLILANALEKVGKLSWKEIGVGLIGLAAALLVMIVASHLLAPVTPAIMGLGVALLLIGGAFALFGFGALQLASAFALIASSGTAGVAVLLVALEGLIKQLPAIIGALGDGMILLVQKILDALPMLIAGLSKSVAALIQLVIDNIPKFVEAAVLLITELLAAIRKLFPDVVATGFAMLMELLRGISDNIGEITNKVIDIILNFLTALTERMPELAAKGAELLVALLEGIAANIGSVITAGVDLLVAFLKGITDSISTIMVAVTTVIVEFIRCLGVMATDIITAGVALLVALLQGISNAIGTIVTAVTEVIVEFIRCLTASAGKLITAGVDLIVALLQGISNAISTIVTAVTSVITEFIKCLGDSASKIVTAGVDMLVAFLKGITDGITKVAAAITGVIVEFIACLGKGATDIATAGGEALVSFLGGITAAIPKVAAAITEVVTAILTALGVEIPKMADGLMKLFIDLFNGIAKAIDDNAAKLGEAMGHLAVSLVKGLGTAILSAIKAIVKDALPGWMGGVVNGIFSALGVKSPSTVFAYLGEMMMAGWRIGIDENMHQPINAINNSGELMVNTMSNTMSKISNALEQNIDFNPTITPVLDLTNVEKEASKLGGILGASALSASLSYDQAASISVASQPQENSVIEAKVSTPTNITFEQNNYSPEALSTTDIYRQTKNQITMAKKELAVL